MSEITKQPCPFCGCPTVDLLRSFTNATWSVRCDACHMFGPDSEDKNAAVERWNALPRRLRWTREKPTKNGWYWWRTGGDCNLRGIVSVCIETDIMVLAGSYKYLSQTTGEWAGPIPEPE